MKDALIITNIPEVPKANPVKKLEKLLDVNQSNKKS
jgi:hypothetical protein